MGKVPGARKSEEQNSLMITRSRSHEIARAAITGRRTRWHLMPMAIHRCESSGWNGANFQRHERRGDD